MSVVARVHWDAMLGNLQSAMGLIAAFHPMLLRPKPPILWVKATLC